MPRIKSLDLLECLGSGPAAASAAGGGRLRGIGAGGPDIVVLAQIS